MPAKRPQRPVPRARIDAAVLTDPAGRVVNDVAIAVRQLESRVRDRSILTADLAIGDNRIAHKLGRKPVGMNVSPTVASAAFAAALTESDDRHAVIEVIGTAQPGAGVEFW